MSVVGQGHGSGGDSGNGSGNEEYSACSILLVEPVEWPGCCQSSHRSCPHDVSLLVGVESVLLNSVDSRNIIGCSRCHTNYGEVDDSHVTGNGGDA